MCGITGYVGEAPIGSEVLSRMMKVMDHRGPDEDGVLLSEGVSFGMKRLSIIDIKSGQQPIHNEDGSLAVVFNGEIYNFPDLRGQLEALGHRFRTRADTECIVHLYEEYGDACVDHLSGMFSFALYDRNKRRLLLARDRAGKKPLYYRLTANGIWFASEVKSLLEDTTFRREVDPEALHHYLTYQYVPAPWSIYRGIKKLPPAHVLSYQGGQVSIVRYWKLEYAKKLAMKDEEAVEQLEELLDAATGARLLSERPVGAFLSGGIDSSLVLASMASQGSAPVATFTIGFEEAAFDERSYARTVAERFGTDHHELVVSNSAADILPILTWHYDEPFADSSAIPSFYLAKLTKEFVTVALTGDGGDESFGGYGRYTNYLRRQRLVSLLGPVRPFAQAGLRRMALLLGSASYLGRLDRAIGRLGIDPAEAYVRLVSYFQHEEKQELYSREFGIEVENLDSRKLVGELFDSSDAENLIDKMLDCDCQSYLPGDLLFKVDIATMANSLEARSPFLDHSIMEFAATLPADQKIRRGTTKVLLKELAKKRLPQELIDRPKMGFGVPIGTWLRGSLREASYDLLLDATARDRGYFDPGYVKRLLDEHSAGSDNSSRIWALLQFERWHREFVDAPASE